MNRPDRLERLFLSDSDKRRTPDLPALAFLVVFAARGGLAATMASAAAPVRRVRGLRETLVPPTVMAREDERIGGRGSSRNGPFGEGF
jgi:hypothetical protein